MPPLAATLAGIAVVAVIIFLFYYCSCKKTDEPLVRKDSESENKEWTANKNGAFVNIQGKTHDF